MAKPSRRLGRGLSSILSIDQDNSQPVPDVQNGAQRGHTGQIAFIKVNQLRPNPSQPRKEMSSEHLKSLADSIRKSGVIQPIVVREVGSDIYEIIVGERRWRAAQLAGLGEVPAIVRSATSEQMLELALVENIFREDLNAIDRAMAYQRYMVEFDLTAEEVANRLGEDRATVSNYLRLLNLPSEVRQMVVERDMMMGHARCLLSLKSQPVMVQAAKEAVAKGWSVRTLEKWVQDHLASGVAAVRDASQRKEKRPLIRDLEQSFVRSLGARVEIFESHRKGRGKIVIYYGQLEDFDRICERLGITMNAD